MNMPGFTAEATLYKTRQLYLLKVADVYSNNEGRVVGAQHNCPPGTEYDAGLCYPPCVTSYHGVGPVCWQDCPLGYADDVAICRRDAHIISADNSLCPWYDKCGLTFAQGCSTCPPGYINDGCTCRINAHIFAKSSYGRGAGRIPGSDIPPPRMGCWFAGTECRGFYQSCKYCCGPSGSDPHGSYTQGCGGPNNDGWFGCFGWYDALSCSPIG